MQICGATTACGVRRYQMVSVRIKFEVNILREVRLMRTMPFQFEFKKQVADLLRRDDFTFVITALILWSHELERNSRLEKT